MSLKRLFIGWANHVNFPRFLRLLCSIENHLSALTALYWFLWLLSVFLQSNINIILRFLSFVDNFNPSNSAVRLAKNMMSCRLRQKSDHISYSGLTFD